MTTHSDILYQVLKNKSHKIGCEVGVHTGATTEILLRLLPDIERYYAVDPWESYKMYDGKNYRKPGNQKAKTWEKAIMVFFRVTRPYKHKVTMLRMQSVDAVNHIDDRSLDWVFIDANHEYEYIKENLHIWTPKVKIGGLITGHDYNNPKEKGQGWGITKAVDEFISKDKLHEEKNYIWWFINE